MEKVHLTPTCVSLVAYYHYKNSLMDPYKKFVGFYTRSQDMFVNYSLVSDAAMSCELQEYGDLTEEVCVPILFLCVIWQIIFLLDFFMKTVSKSRSIMPFTMAFLKFPRTSQSQV